MFAAIKHQEHQIALEEAMKARGESPEDIKKALQDGNKDFFGMLGGVFFGALKGTITGGGSIISTVIGGITGGVKSIEK